MKHITFITGGQRSGKSSFAQKLAMEQSANPVYLATARKWDDDFEKRIQRHQSDRNEQWQTIEEEKELGTLKLEGRTVVLDCITLWLTNIFHDMHYDMDKTLDYAKNQWETFSKQEIALFVVSNELGMSIHPENEIARKFADLQGWMNQYIAHSADEAFLMVAGIPLKVK